MALSRTVSEIRRYIGWKSLNLPTPVGFNPSLRTANDMRVILVWHCTWSLSKDQPVYRNKTWHTDKVYPICVPCYVSVHWLVFAVRLLTPKKKKKKRIKWWWWWNDPRHPCVLSTCLVIYTISSWPWRLSLKW